MKAEIRERLKPLNAELNRYSAKQYGKDQDNIPDEAEYKQEFAEWQRTHQPFHWFVEFYSIMRDGGFDVIIGNPPYVEYKELKNYKLLNILQTSSGKKFVLLLFLNEQLD